MRGYLVALKSTQLAVFFSAHALDFSEAPDLSRSRCKRKDITRGGL
ncbi:hypothetical protein [Paraburkholderia aspalathi]|uniref:Uncharacterized protein n=1 Tax=Paraburkholderia aspalathi TaxID=1324617 RepID=A0A1I7CEI3_9BURK|nr:hypothetical protein [Paraburkholderia aspalathi]SFT97801.1 hypothetical protein SAMN05192563_1006167 [Paraburkholderia aspalathi]